MLLRTAIEHAGAERGVLIMAQGSELRIKAEASTEAGAVTIGLRDTPISGDVLPESILHYTARTQESVILDDALARGAFSEDEYVRRQRARSILCLPLVKQGKLIAVLYLDNNLAAGVFTPARIAVLKVLASEAAMSLENSRLYRELQEREARIRRLVDANIVGIFIWDFDGNIHEANDAFLHIVGYEREDIVSRRLSWRTLTPGEWLERDDQRWIPELKMRGSLAPFEKEYLRKDGSRVPVLLGAATFDEGEHQWCRLRARFDRAQGGGTGAARKRGAMESRLREQPHHVLHDRSGRHDRFRESLWRPASRIHGGGVGGPFRWRS